MCVKYIYTHIYIRIARMCVVRVLTCSSEAKLKLG